MGVEFSSKIIDIEVDLPLKLQIWDTAGSEKFRSVTRSYYRDCICCTIVYDITNKKSFKHVKKWLSDIRENSYEKVITLLIGNKKDLEDKREVSENDAREFALANDILFCETSTH